ncbi:MAG: hypothetical protein DME23_15930 [Verrucomicrobia bacterium]|nr:MAG: hypothetical protein DME23_15930 [Verrucomicrobiota bacterium]
MATDSQERNCHDSFGRLNYSTPITLWCRQPLSSDRHFDFCWLSSGLEYGVRHLYPFIVSI